MFPVATESNFIGSGGTSKIDKTFIKNKFKEIKDSIKNKWNSTGNQTNNNTHVDPMFPFGTNSDFINNKINESILNGKVTSIKAIIEKNPDTNFILLGDNGQLDPDVYKQIQDLYPNRVRVYIHHVYAGLNNSTVNYSYTNSRKRFEIYHNQTPYYTAADLAVQFYNIGVISREDVLKTLGSSIQAIDPTQGTNSNLTKNQHLFYQSWMTGCLGFMNTEWNKLVMVPIENDQKMSFHLTYLKDIITSYPGCTPTL